VRRAIQDSEESVRALATRYGVSKSTVQKWKKRRSVADLPMGPKALTSTVLSSDEEAVVVAFRKHTLLPLDDCFYVLQSTIPYLTRSSLHRCLQRHGISRLPDMDGAATRQQRSASRPARLATFISTQGKTLGRSAHQGKQAAPVRRAKGGAGRRPTRAHRTSRFAFARLEEKSNQVTATAFL